MIGLGTIINVAAIVAGGLIGLAFSRAISARYQETLMQAIGVCVIFVGISGAVQEMMTVTSGGLKSGGTMMMVISYAVGSLLGEWIDLEHRIEQFGKWLKEKTGNAGEKRFVDGFVTASLTVSIGAMAVVGAIQDGISGDYSTLALKAVLDMVIICVMSASLGKGCVFAAIPVGVLQGDGHPARQGRSAGDDRGRALQPVLDRVDPDLLCGRQSAVGEETESREYAAVHCHRGALRLCGRVTRKGGLRPGDFCIAGLAHTPAQPIVYGIVDGQKHPPFL